MPARHRHSGLFRKIASLSELLIAARKVINEKRRKPDSASFLANIERELLRQERETLECSYRPDRYVEIVVRDPTERFVSAAPFRDRVVHHVQCALICPIFEAGVIGNTFASRKRCSKLGGSGQCPECAEAL